MPALVGYVTECNENKRLNLECFGDRVPSQKEGSLTLFTSAAALGIILSSKVTAAGLLKFLRDGEMGFGWRAMGKDTRQRLAAVSGHVAAWAAPAGLAQLIVVKLQQRARPGPPQACALCPWPGDPLLEHSLWQDVVSADLPCVPGPW